MQLPCSCGKPQWGRTRIELPSRLISSALANCREQANEHRASLVSQQLIKIQGGGMAILASGFLFAHRICEGYNPPEFRTGPNAEAGSRLNRSEHLPVFLPIFL